MFKNYFIVAYRNLVKHKFYSCINIIGLSIGITACILVGLFIKQDLSYDKYHKNAGQIYRVYYSHNESGGTMYESQSPALLGPTLKSLYPEIKNFSRVYFTEHNLVKIGNKINYEDRIIYADSTFFEIFSYQAVAGNMAGFLKKPNTIILTESIAEKYFGNEYPLGKEIELNNKYRFEVAGVIKDVPKNSHFKFDFIATYSSLDKQEEAIYLKQWGATFGSYTYLLVENGFDPHAFEEKTKNFFQTKISTGESWRVLVKPLLDIHLNSHNADEIEENSSVSRILIISSIALFILLLACMNFVNLTTARSSKRAVEIGIRKVLGAVRFQLVRQFLGESILLSLLSLMISFVLVLLTLPSFSALTGTKIFLDLNSNWSTLLWLSACVILVGIIAGIYPALVVSSFQPVNAIKGYNPFAGGKQSGSYLRKGLIILQFSISIILITGTIIVNLQLKYMRDYNMGFEKEYMLVLPAHDDVRNNYTTIKSELKNIPGISSTTACLGSPVTTQGILTQCQPNGVGNGRSFRINVNSVDFDYMNHFGVKLIAGRNLSSDFQTDYTKAMVINETMAHKLGFNNVQDAIGKSYFISLNGYKPEIVGVVRDYNSSSLHNEVMSLVFMHKPKWFSEFIVKVNSSNMPSTIGRVKDLWAKYFPQYPFEYHFLDDSINQMYKSEEIYSQVISTFSGIALFIACLGLVGLTSFVTERRKKEIGVRKVLGASVINITRNIAREFVILVILANIIAWPTAYYFMNKWLRDFAYRISLSWWIFFISGLLTLLIALLTICYLVVKAARSNPINCLRSE